MFFQFQNKKEEEKPKEKPRTKSRWFYSDTAQADDELEEQLKKDIDMRIYYKDKFKIL